MESFEGDSANYSSTKASEVLRSLKLREEARLTDVQRSREAQRKTGAASESATDFLDAWRGKEEQVTLKLQSLERNRMQKEAAEAVLRDTGEAISLLEKEAADASSYLTVYHTEQIGSSLKSLKQRLESARAAALPKKKFAFSKRTAAAGVKNGAEKNSNSREVLTSTNSEAPQSCCPEATVASLPNKRAAFTAKSDPSRTLKGLREKVIVKLTEELKGGDFVLEDLHGCTVCLLGALSALRAHRLSHCRVIAAPVSGAAFFHELHKCELVVAAGQMRLHNSTETDVYLRTRSSPVVEGCSRMRFAPFQLHGSSSCEAELAAAGLSDASSSWQDVQDFDWIRATPSPNWCILGESERKFQRIPAGQQSGSRDAVERESL